MTSTPMRLAPGAQIGCYEIIEAIGAGGMGEVYRAHDTELNRDVAIKVLPDAVACDAERLARFQREARVLASLNHPNIAHIHGLQRTDDTTALVMELVGGATLADRIARGPIPVGEALAIAKQIAEALDAAHDSGIIHRDLKPANIKVREDGTVKVLDFGLAKTIEPLETAGAASASVTPTITSPAMTRIGIVLGTAAYMSPEQARGRAADKRADVWAFGAVLYEMLTGRRAFEGENVSETLANVLRGEPDWHALPAGLPPEVMLVLRRSLARDRRERLRDIGDAHLLLDDLSIARENGSTPRPPGLRNRGILPWSLDGSRPDELLLPPESPGPVPYSWSPDGKFILHRYMNGGFYNTGLLPLSGQRVPRAYAARGYILTFAHVSPDGRSVAYNANDSGRFEVFIESFPVPGQRLQVSTDGGVHPRWRRDGREVYYYAPDGRLMAAPIAPGSASAVGMPVPLFQARLLGGPAVAVGVRAQYDVAADGRFLLNVPVAAATQPVIHVALNGAVVGKR